MLAVKTNKPAIAGNVVNELTDAERILLRKALEVSGEKRLTNNLFYNYETQQWIKPDADEISKDINAKLAEQQNTIQHGGF